MITIHSKESSFWQRINTKMAFYLLAIVVIALASLYVYFMNKTVMNVVERENIEKKIAEQASDIAEIEFAYIAAKNTVTLERAHEIGFVDAIPSSYVARKDSPVAFLYER